MAGYERLPDQERFFAAFKESIPIKGLYFFPGMDKDASTVEIDASMELHRTGPSGILLINPHGSDPMPPRVFIVGFVTDFLCALCLAIVLSQISAGPCKCAGIGGMLGFFA